MPRVWLPAWEKVPVFTIAQQGWDDDQDQQASKTRIRLTALARLAADRLRLLPGDVRLIGWTDQRLPGMRFKPEAAQNRTYTLVLAHLAHGKLPTAQPDRNLAEDFIDPDLLDPKSDADLLPEGPDTEQAAPPGKR